MGPLLTHIKSKKDKTGRWHWFFFSPLVVSFFPTAFHRSCPVLEPRRRGKNPASIPRIIFRAHRGRLLTVCTIEEEAATTKKKIMYYYYYYIFFSSFRFVFLFLLCYLLILLLKNGQGLVKKGVSGRRSEIGSRVSWSAQDPLGRQQTLDAHRSTSMNPSRADPYFRSCLHMWGRKRRRKRRKVYTLFSFLPMQSSFDWKRGSVILFQTDLEGFLTKFLVGISSKNGKLVGTTHNRSVKRLIGRKMRRLTSPLFHILRRSKSWFDLL